MRKRLLLWLLVFMAITSVGWLHAEGDGITGTISSELLRAQSGREVVFGIITRQGNVPNNTMVRVSLTAKDNAFDSWKSYYYEPNGNTPGWVEWNPENDGFGPEGGFPFQDATSYIKVVPVSEGEFEYTLTVTKVGEQTPLITKTQKLEVSEAPVAPMAQIGETQYASLGTAIHFAKDNEIVKLTSGHFNLVQGTEKVTAGNNEAGWYLPITQKGLTIEGVKGEGENQTFIESDVKTVNGIWSSQNMITVFADGVTLKNMIIKSKEETNKAIEILAQDFKMSNVQVGIFAENTSGFGGSVYFNKPNIGTVTIENSQLIKSRITFTGAQTGNVALKDVVIDYKDVVVDGTNMETLQQYGPFGATTGKPNLKITAENLQVSMSATDKKYKLDANTIANLPANTALHLNNGEYQLSSQLVIDKPIFIRGTVANGVPTTVLSATGDRSADNSKDNLISIEGKATGTVSISGVKITGSKASGINVQSSMDTELDQVLLENNTNAGLIVHSKVTATGLKTKENRWGGVNIDKGSPSFATISFIFDATSSFAEPLQIWSEITDNSALVTTPANVADWRNYVTNGVRVWSNASLESTAADAEELKAKIAIAQPGQVVTLTGTEYALNEALTIKSESLTLKSEEGKNAKLTFASGGLIVDADNVKLIGLDVTATTGNALIVNAGKKGMSVEKGSYINVVEGKQGEGAIRFNGDNGDIKVSDATLKGGIHVLDYAGGDLAGITKNTITIEGAPDSPLCGIIVAGAEDKVSAIKLPALDLYKQQTAITMPVTGAQCDVLYQNTKSSPWAAVDGVATPESAAELSAVAAFDNHLTILLEAKAYEFSSQLDITKSVKLIGSISGQDTTSIITKDWVTDNSDKNKNTLIQITAENVALSNLNVKDAARNGINVYSVTGITLDNVTVQKSKAAALVVNGSKVTATNFHTSGSGWGYGVNVDKGSGVEVDPVFTIGADCSFGEAIAIKSDLENAPGSYVAGAGWVMMKKTAGDNTFTVWANAASSGINLAITSVPATVVWGAKELPLVANVAEPTFGISEGVGVVEIVDGDDNKKSLKILKPGKATLTLTANDITIQQAVTVLKKTLTVTGITATERAYDRGTEVALVIDDITVNGLVGEDKNVISDFSGKRTSANAGEAVPVEVTATFAEGKADYYTLAPITGVTVKVKKVDLTLTTAALEAINYGATLPVFDIVRDDLQFVEGDSFEDLTGELKFDCPVTKTTLAGTYKVTPFGYTSPNYNIQYQPADLEVNAIAPTAEITNMKVNAVGSNASVTVSGRILNNGGTATDQLMAKLEAKTGSSTTKTVDNIKIVNGTFTVDVTGLSGATYTIDLTIKASESLSSAAVSSSELALAAKMQNIRFSSELNRLTYGATADLKAEGYQSGAKVVYTTDKPEVLAFNEDFTGVVAKGAGTAVITATATLDEYVTAVAKQTVTVEPRIVTVKATASDKTYNGQTDATVDYKASGILPEDAAVLLNASGMKAAFTDKNADEKEKTVILSGTCSLDGNEKGNYALVQPTNPTAKINPATISAITVSNVKRKYNETSLHYDLSANGLIGEALTDAGLYTGTISVKETEEGTYTLNTTNVKFRNYTYAGKITTGSIEIKKGVPSVVTFNKEGGNGVEGKIVDYAGWSDNDLKLEIEAGKDSESETSRAVCIYPEGKVMGNAVTTEATAPTLNIQLADIIEEASVTPATANRLMTRANTAVSMSYGEVKKLTVGEGEFTFETLNPGVLTIDEKQRITATGAGTGVILVTANSRNGVAQITIPVTPALLTVEAAGLDRAYNGQTTVDLALALKGDINAATLDLTNITFNYASKDVQDNLAIYPSKEIVLTGENAANYKLDAIVLKGKITPRELTLTSQISKYYDGSNTMTLKEYSAEGLLADEAAPELTITITDEKVGKEKTVSALKVASANYSLKNEPSSVKANIVKSKLLAEIPTKATSPTDVINNIGYTVYETGATIAKGSAVAKAIGKSYIKVTGSNPFNVTDVANGDCELVLSSNTIGKTSTPPVTPPDEPEDVAVSSVELDITAKSLPRTESFVLTATLNKGEEAPTNKAITWKSSDETIVKVESTGDFTAKVTALAVGDATITVTTEDGAKTAICEVTVDFATGLEEAIANTRVSAKEGSICIEPQMPMNVMVVSMAGNTIYKNVIHSTTYIPISASGIYIIKLGQGNDAKVHKVKVD